MNTLALKFITQGMQPMPACGVEGHTTKTTKRMIAQNFKISILSCFVGLAVVSCSEEEVATTTTQTQVQTNVKSGTWRITKFIDSGTSETNHFTGYNFTFNNSGVLNANNGTNNYDGTWSVTDSNSSNDDDSQDDLDFNINFSLSNDFEDLSDDWDFVSQSTTKIELVDVSGGNGGIDSLTFERN
jgi:hypothetical protein